MADLIDGLGGPAGFGESTLGPTDDDSTGKIDISSAFPDGLNYFGTTYDELFLNNNGSISFEDEVGLLTTPLDDSSFPIIVPLGVDVDTTGDETGLGPTPGGTSEGTDLVYFDLDAANGTFTATWDDVGEFDSDLSSRNAFQIQLIDQGGGDFDVVFRYEDVGFATIGGEGDSDGGGSPSPAQVGFASGGGDIVVALPASEDEAALLALPNTPGIGTGEDGVFLILVREGEVVFADAVNDAFATESDTAVSGNVFADNGNGPDISSTGDPSDLDVSAVDGDSDAVGEAIVLTSGATLTLEADGSFTYDPSGASAFEGLAAGTVASDSFTYEITQDESTDTAGVTVAVEIVDEPPAFAPPLTFTVDEGETDVGTLVATDPNGEPITYTILAGEDDGPDFSLDPDSGELTFDALPDFEDPDDEDGDNTYEFRVEVSDGTLTTQADVTVTVTNVNEEPVLDPAGPFEVPEGQTEIVTLTASDPDDDDLEFSIVGANDFDDFVIDEVTGALAFAEEQDFEAPTDAGGDGVFSVIVQVSDEDGLFDRTTVVVQLTDVAEDLAFVSDPDFTAEFPEGLVGTVEAQDADDDAVRYSIAGGEDAADFSIDPATGALSFVDLEGGTPTDDDADGVFELTIEAESSDAEASQSVTVTVEDPNEAPTITSAFDIVVAENNAEVGDVVAEDPEGDLLTYAIVGGEDADAFLIDEATGALSFAEAPDFETPDDADGDNEYELTVEASDGSFTDTQELSVTILDVDEGSAPTAVDDVLPEAGDPPILSTEGGGDVDGNVTDNDLNPEDVEFEIVEVGELGEVGSPVPGDNGGLFTIEADGDVDFDANGEFNDLDVGETALTSVEYTIGFEVPANAFDIVLLQDLSGSFSDDLANVETQVLDVLDTFGEDLNLAIGLASYVDKPISPFGGFGDFVYRTDLSPTTDRDAIETALSELTTFGGGDGPEAQLEALLQLAVRAETEVDFREDVQRIVVLTTDADFHVAGDFAAAGPNDGDDEIEDEDYPSVDQVRSALDAADIIPIFLVTPDQVTTYEALVDELGFGTVEELTPDSSNLADAVEVGVTTVGGTSTASLTVEVSGTDIVNAVPVTLDDTAVAIAGETLTVSVLDGVLANDLDPEGDELTAVRIAGPNNGTFELNDDGSFTYTPNEGFVGTETILYRAFDGAGPPPPMIGPGAGGPDLARLTITVVADDGAGAGEGDDEEDGDDDALSDVGASVEPLPGGGLLMTGTNEADRISTGDGGTDDRLSGLAGNDTLYGRAGNDTLLGGTGDDKLAGQSGDDNVEGGAGRDFLVGAAGDDNLIGGSGADTLLGQDGNDTVNGGADADTLRGGRGEDVVLGEGGGDLVTAGGGFDTVSGGEGDDRIFGMRGSDVLGGGEGDDRLSGGIGLDTLSGDAGDDTLRGGEHNDTLIGGIGDDVLVLGEGADTMVFEAGFGDDRVVGFRSGVDVLDLTALDGAEVSISQQGRHTVIATGEDSITLLQFDAADLAAGDLLT